MLQINEGLVIPESELTWKFARAGGPGGQNVNKVASKAILFWDLAKAAYLPATVKERVQALFPRYVTSEGSLVISSQRHRDQDRNREDCLEKLRQIIVQASFVPKARKKTKPSRSSKRRRLADKKHRAQTKQLRRAGGDD